jgi:hypothetical protein
MKKGILLDYSPRSFLRLRFCSIAACTSPAAADLERKLTLSFHIPDLCPARLGTSVFLRVHAAIRQAPFQWLLWSTVGFGLFYAPISFAGDHAKAGSSPQAGHHHRDGLLLSPLFQKRIAVKNLGAAAVILVGVFLLQVKNIVSLNTASLIGTLPPILIAAVSYPLGNRKMMALCPPEMTTIERVYGMTLCSLPFGCCSRLLVSSRSARLRDRSHPVARRRGFIRRDCDAALLSRDGSRAP